MKTTAINVIVTKIRIEEMHFEQQNLCNRRPKEILSILLLEFVISIQLHLLTNSIIYSIERKRSIHYQCRLYDNISLFSLTTSVRKYNSMSTYIAVSSGIYIDADEYGMSNDCLERFTWWNSFDYFEKIAQDRSTLFTHRCQSTIRCTCNWSNFYSMCNINDIY